jgi:hypothetical protein
VAFGLATSRFGAGEHLLRGDQELDVVQVITLGPMHGSIVAAPQPVVNMPTA